MSKNTARSSNRVNSGGEMAVHGLAEVAKSHRIHLATQALEGWTLGIDGDYLIIQTTTTAFNPRMRGPLQRLLSLAETGVRPVLVLDGTRPTLKCMAERLRLVERGFVFIGRCSPRSNTSLTAKDLHHAARTGGIKSALAPKPVVITPRKRSAAGEDLSYSPCGTPSKQAHPKAKLKVHAKGKAYKRRDAAPANATDAAYSSMTPRACREFPQLMRTLELIGIPVLWARGESDELLGFLARPNGEVDAAASDDHDSLVFGAQQLVSMPKFADGISIATVNLLYRDDLLTSLGIEEDVFVKVCPCVANVTINRLSDRCACPSAVHLVRLQLLQRTTTTLTVRRSATRYAVPLSRCHKSSRSSMARARRAPRAI